MAVGRVFLKDRDWGGVYVTTRVEADTIGPEREVGPLRIGLGQEIDGWDFDALRAIAPAEIELPKPRGHPVVAPAPQSTARVSPPDDRSGGGGAPAPRPPDPMVESMKKLVVERGLVRRETPAPPPPAASPAAKRPPSDEGEAVRSMRRFLAERGIRTPAE